MPRGGARVNSGPPPDPNALRRDRPSDKDGWTALPAAGRQGDPPVWPLPPEVATAAQLELARDARLVLEGQIDDGTATKGAPARLARLDQKIAELESRLRAAAEMEFGLWSDLWSTPQAVMWERLRWTREVALYVRWQVLAELGDLDAGKEARQWSDRLGLNPAAMLRNRWRVDGAVSDGAQSTGPRPRKAPTRRSARDRLRLVNGGA